MSSAVRAPSGPRGVEAVYQTVGPDQVAEGLLGAPVPEATDPPEVAFKLVDQHAEPLALRVVDVRRDVEGGHALDLGGVDERAHRPAEGLGIDDRA